MHLSLEYSQNFETTFFQSLISILMFLCSRHWFWFLNCAWLPLRKINPWNHFKIKSPIIDCFSAWDSLCRTSSLSNINRTDEFPKRALNNCTICRKWTNEAEMCFLDKNDILIEKRPHIVFDDHFCEKLRFVCCRSGNLKTKLYWPIKCQLLELFWIFGNCGNRKTEFETYILDSSRGWTILVQCGHNGFTADVQ